MNEYDDAVEVGSEEFESYEVEGVLMDEYSGYLRHLLVLLAVALVGFSWIWYAVDGADSPWVLILSLASAGVAAVLRP